MGILSSDGKYPVKQFDKKKNEFGIKKTIIYRRAPPATSVIIQWVDHIQALSHK